MHTWLLVPVLEQAMYGVKPAGHEHLVQVRLVGEVPSPVHGAETYSSGDGAHPVQGAHLSAAGQLVDPLQPSATYEPAGHPTLQLSHVRVGAVSLPVQPPAKNCPLPHAGHLAHVRCSGENPSPGHSDEM